MWCCILANFILLLIFFALLLVANCGCWLIMFAFKPFDSMVENLYSFFADSENIGSKASKPWRKGHQWTGMNSVLMTSSNCLSWFLMFGIFLMKYIGLCLDPLIKPEYTAWGSHHAILNNTRNFFIHWSIHFYLFLFTINHDLLPPRKHPNLGPSLHKVSHQFLKRKISCPSYS